MQPTVTAEGEKAPALKFGQPRVMALLLALPLVQHLIDGFLRNGSGILASHFQKPRSMSFGASESQICCTLL